MKNILVKLLYILVTGCGTAVATFLCVLLKSKISELSSKIKNTKLTKYINAATEVVTKAVLDVSQTYVDALKNTGEFTKEAQVIAKEKAIDIATKLITEDGKKAVEEIYGDFSIWLSTTIESNVKKNK